MSPWELRGKGSCGPIPRSLCENPGAGGGDQDLAKGREGVLRHWVGMARRESSQGTIPQTSETGSRKMS